MPYQYDLAIDPGHGGNDPGANGYGVNEKDWTLKISKYQYDRLKELGVKVLITRTTDKTLDSGPRTALIKNKARYCMSNHFNAANSSARGVEVIHSVWTDNKLAKRLADAICDASKLPFRRVFSKQADWTKSKLDYYFIPRETGNTESLIVEYGFIDNKDDNAYYKNEDNFYKVAEAVVKEWCAILGKKYIAPGKKENSSSAKPSKPKVKTVSQMADEVIAGKHGNGHDNRRKSLGISLALYEKVRAEINRRAGVKSPPKTKKTVSQMADMIIKNPKAPTGHENRRKWLGIDNATYQKVRAEVNKRL